MIVDFGHLFPQWVGQPGVTSPAACETVLKAAGLQVTVLWPATSVDVVARFAEPNTAGAMLFVNKFYADVATRQALSDINHILRLTKADQNGIEVMNPYRCPSPAVLDTFSWQEVVSFQGFVGVFRK
jgi:hypothetical protein